MTAIYSVDMRISNAKNFIRSIASATSSKDLLYAFIGRGSAWGGGTDSNGAEIVPAPTDNLTEELVTRSNMFGIKRITEADVSHVIRRINWTSGVTYVAYAVGTLTATLYASNFYVITDQNNVYKCIITPGTASTVKPTGTSVSNLTTGDGYTWKYMYTVSTTDALKFLTTAWMPVPTGSRRDTAQLAVEAAASYAAGQTLYGNGHSAVDELGGYYLLFSMIFNGSENSTLPTNDDFRQVGLLLNPSLSDSNGDLASANNYSAAAINKNTGRMIYVENRTPIVRSSTQSETVRLVLQY